MADEVDPGYIFGKVKDFVQSRSCPTNWLIEEGERKRIEARGTQSGPFEYTLYLEEDCPGKVVYYVFVDRSQANAGPMDGVAQAIPQEQSRTTIWCG